MRPRYLFFLLLILAALCGSLCVGCWNRREPELLGIVMAVGFDYDQEKNLYRVIAQLSNPVALGQSGGGESGGGGGNSGGKKPFWTTEAKGHTPYEATRNLIETSSRELFFAHCRVVLFSERLARRGLKDVFDLLERSRQFRLIAKPAIVQGDLRKIMEADFPLEKTGARGLDRFIVNTNFERSIFPEINLNEVISIFSQVGRQVFIGRLSVLETRDESREEGAGSAPKARIGGAALFRGDRMVGWADNIQTQGWTYTTGRAFRSEFVVKNPEREDSLISVGTFGHSAKMNLQGDGKDLRIRLELKIHGRLQEFGGPGRLDSENKLIRSLERRSAQAVRNRVESMISRSQELKSDIVGFGNLIYRKNPKLWQELEDRWDEEIYPQLKVDVKVIFMILRSGLTNNPL